MGGGGELPRARGVQEARRARPAGAQQARGLRRRRPRLLLRDGDGRGAGPRALRRRADGHRRADRHVHAGAGPLRQRRAAARVPGARRSRARWWAASASASPAPAATWPASRAARARTATTTSSAARRCGSPTACRPTGCACWSTPATGRAAHEQVAGHRADGQPRHREGEEDPQDRHAFERHRPDLLRRGARAAALSHRRGGPGLHLPDAAVPGGAPVVRRQLARADGGLHPRDHRMGAGAQALRRHAGRPAVGAVQAGRAARPRSRRCAR